jgi:hypothetical protein
MWTLSPISAFAFFLFSHSFRITPRVQKIGRSTKDFVFGKMKGGMNKEEVEKLS